MLNTIVSNSHFGKRPAAGEMTSFVSHIGTQGVNSYWWNSPLGRMLQGWFLVFYYCHVHKTANYGYTSSGAWTFCEFVDVRLFIYARLDTGEGNGGRVGGGWINAFRALPPGRYENMSCMPRWGVLFRYIRFLVCLVRSSLRRSCTFTCCLACLGAGLILLLCLPCGGVVVQTFANAFWLECSANELPTWGGPNPLDEFAT